MPYTNCIPSLVKIGQRMFSVECPNGIISDGRKDGRKEGQNEVTPKPALASGNAGKNCSKLKNARILKKFSI